MMRSMRARREAPAGAQVNIPVVNRRVSSVGNQARLRRSDPSDPTPLMPIVEIAHNDPGAPDSTVNLDDSLTDEVTGDGGNPAAQTGGAPEATDVQATQAPTTAPATSPAPAPGVTPPSGPPPCQCDVASGPTYTPSGAIPVTTSGDTMSATFNMAASFVNNPSAGKPASCCHVRQFIKWDARYAAWRGGPPHAGFGSTAPDTWIEDRNADDTLRYGHRSPPHYLPSSGCGNEYKTGTVQDMANGDTFCGRDTPGGPTSRPAPDGTPMPRVGVYSFQLKVVDSGGAVKQSSSVITVTWG